MSDLDKFNYEREDQIDIFDLIRKPISITKPIRLIELFAGYGSQAMALRDITFENEHDENLNVEIPVSKWIWNSRNEEPYTLSVNKDLTISSLRNLSEFEVLLLRLSRAGTAIIIDKEYDDDYIQPVKQPEASFS